MEQFSKYAERTLDGLVILGMLSMSAIVFWQFFSRYALSFSLTWSEEIATFVMIWAGLLGLVSHLRQGDLIGVDLLGYFESRWLRLVGKLIAEVSTAVFFLLVIWLGLGMSVFSDATGMTSAAQIPLRWIYLIYPLMAAGILLRLLVRWRRQWPR